MSIWNSQNQSQPNNTIVGQAQFNPYLTQSWNIPQKLPVYTATPIQGEHAAWQFPMGPHSEIWLPDADKDLVWWIRTDANGNRSVKPFDVKPHEEAPSIDTNELAARLAAVEEWINGKQNKSNAKRNTNATATTTANVTAVVE